MAEDAPKTDVTLADNAPAATNLESCTNDAAAQPPQAVGTPQKDIVMADAPIEQGSVRCSTPAANWLVYGSPSCAEETLPANFTMS
jgi:hypothetical protein